MVTITHNAVEELSSAIQELEQLTSKPTLTGRDEKRHAFLLAKVSLLKAGISPTEIRRYEQDRLLHEAGLPRAPERARTRLDEDTENEWRSFALGKPVRETYVPPEREIRAYAGELAGAQSLTYTFGPTGGYFVAPGMASRLYQTLKQLDDIFNPEFCNIFETPTGGLTSFPIWDDVNNQAVLVGETVQSGEVEIASLSSSQLRAYAYRSKIVAVSLELLQDSNWPIGSVLERVFAKRIARGVGQAMITGTGVNQPTGLITAAIAAGAKVIVASGSATNTGGSETGTTTIGTIDLGRLYAALDPAYRDATATFYMNDNTLQYLRQLLDKQGRPLIELGRDGLTGAQSATPYLLGKRVAICPSMPLMASTANSIVFANPDYIIQRRVPSSIFLRRYCEAQQLVEAGLVGFEEWCRFDSNLVSGNASYVPAAVLQQHS
ncbi:MAG TPA: phage major capsid protein [Candidatus Acidoferrum sp.]|nr:phage major capsid protein [Candidatus Acidoferrum sp.]